ncbi:hypothetical protein ACIQI8_44400 [Streptomyces sp. NPDC092369]
MAIASNELFGKAHMFPANLCQAAAEQRGFLEREIIEPDVSFVS